MAYALVSNGSVAEIAAQTFPVNAALQWIEIPDGIAVAENWTYSGGTFAAPPSPPAQTLAQQANAQLADGVAVTFSASTALSATYSTTLAAQVKIMAEANWLIKNSTFVNGTTTLILVDITGTQRAFNPTQFAAFEAAYAPYISAVDLVADSNQGTLPAATLTVDA